MRRCVLLRSVRSLPISNNMLTIRTFLFSPQRQLHMPQKHKATVPDSTLRVEMNNLEEQADNAKARELFWKPLSWLGAIRPTSANDAFDPALWETFVSTTLGLEVRPPTPP